MRGDDLVQVFSPSRESEATELEEVLDDELVKFPKLDGSVDGIQCIGSLRFPQIFMARAA